MKNVKFVKESLNENLNTHKYLYAIYKFSDDDFGIYTDFFFSSPQEAISKFEKRKRSTQGTFDYQASTFLIQIDLDAIPGSIFIDPETEKSKGGVKIIKSTVGEEPEIDDEDFEDEDFEDEDFEDEDDF